MRYIVLNIGSAPDKIAIVCKVCNLLSDFVFVAGLVYYFDSVEELGFQEFDALFKRKVIEF